MIDRADEVSKKIKEKISSGKQTKASELLPIFGDSENIPNPNDGDYKSDFTFGYISEERCKQINSCKISDPYRQNPYFDAMGHFFVKNVDESVLFCRGFSSREWNENRYIVYIYFLKNEYHFIEFEFYDISDIEQEGKAFRYTKIGIKKYDFIEKLENKKEQLRILADAVSTFDRRSYFVPVNRIFRYKVFYDGEEII
ncbi:MAG: hypothetical protein NC393_01815 [Clostridium sp.]|nr:hypothetical protein [Clostridium sp.]MCM1170840.1 hypothetical protein [Clostridium sp.]